MSIRKLFAISLIAAAVGISPAIAQEVSAPPAPEFKQYQREGVIEPSIQGLAKELSEQAKVIADLQEYTDHELNSLCLCAGELSRRLERLEASCKADCNHFSTSEAEINKRLARLEEKVSRLIKILKLQKEAVK